MAQITSGSTINSNDIFNVTQGYITQRGNDFLNGRGEWIKTNTGQMICWNRFQQMAEFSYLTHSSMPIYRASHVWVFPQVFSSAPHVIGSVGQANQSSLASWLHIPSNSITTSQITCNVEGPYGYNADQMWVQIMAIGSYS